MLLGGGHAGHHDDNAGLPAASATYITAGDGLLYLVAETTSPANNVRAYHVEVFDPVTSQGQVLSPVVLSNVGSAIAHMGFIYGDGALWLYGYSYPAAEPAVVQISPATGAVERTIRSVPEIGGTFPTVAADRAGPGSAAVRAGRRGSTGCAGCRSGHDGLCRPGGAEQFGALALGRR